MVEKRRCAVVTGGAKGIGAGIARRLVARGFWVAIFDRDLVAGQTTAAELEHRACFFQVDVSKEASVVDGIAAVKHTAGRIDALVNNAGISDPSSGPIETLSLERWNQVIATNLTGYFLCSKHALPLLRQQAGSAIVNIASTRALQSEPDSEAYAASKGGIVALTHALAVSAGSAVRVNCISPGWIDTGDGKLREVDHAQHPAGRVGVPEDVATLTAFLLSKDAEFITGQNFIVDGGMVRKMMYAD